MNDRETVIYALVIIGLFVVLPLIYYNQGYRAGVRDSFEEPTPLRIMAGVVPLNVSMYNTSWYDIGFGDPEEQPIPTLRNDSFLMYINAYWGASEFYASNDGKIPHATITIEILPFDYGDRNFTIERVVICWRSMIEGQHIDNRYDNNTIEISSVDSVGIIFFGYGSYQNNIDIWVTRYTAFTVGPVWYEEEISVVEVIP